MDPASLGDDSKKKNSEHPRLPPWAPKLGDHTNCALCLGEIPAAPKLGDIPGPEPCSPLEISWLHAWRHDSTRNPKTGRSLKPNGRLWRQTNKDMASIVARLDPDQWKGRALREKQERFSRQIDTLAAACLLITENARHWLSGCELVGEKLCCPLCGFVCAERLEHDECHGCDSWTGFAYQCGCSTTLELSCAPCAWAHRYLLRRKQAPRNAFLQQLRMHR